MSTTQKRKLISIVTPVFNEQGNIVPAYEAVKEVFDNELSEYDFEMIFTDNHSTDASFIELRQLAEQDKRVSVYRFSRNFGYQLSILTGYRHARGDAAVQLDCDLEDPPGMIVEFVRKWEDGCDVVYGIRKKRAESMLMQLIRKLFYRVLYAISYEKVPLDAGDFRLLDRRVLDELCLVEDPHVYIRGRVALLGFRQEGIEYERQPRRSGVTKFSFVSLVRLGLDAILCHSTVPLRIASIFGTLLFIGSILGTVGYIILKLTIGDDWPAGFATLVVLLLLTTGLNGIFLGIIGEYLARVYQHLKHPSRVIIQAKIENADGGLADDQQQQGS